jgi:iron complex outermembrane receptor protein
VAGAAVWAENSFTYTDQARIGRPTDTMTNSRVRQQGATGSVAYEVNERNRLRLDGLYLRNDRQLPPTMVSPAARDALMDEKALVIAGWERNGTRSATDVRVSYAYSDQDFFDSQADTNYLNRSHTLRIRAAQQFLLGRRFTCIARHNSDMAWGRSSSGYADGVFRHMHQTTLSVVHRPLAWLSGEVQVGVVALNARAYPGPFLIGSGIRVLQGWELRGNLSANMRFPTLNDLYWYPGGNLALRPEHLLAAEVGTRFDRRIRSWRVLASFQVFVAGYSDLIQWQPGPSYWVPENVRSTLNKGTETELGFDVNLNKLGVMVRLMHQWNRAYMDMSSVADDPVVGQQLIYVPEHQAKMILSIEVFGARIGADAQYVSGRNVATDGSSVLPPYWLAAAHVGYTFKWNRAHSIAINLSLDNILDQQYQTMAWRPMPGRNWTLGLQYRFN